MKERIRGGWLLLGAILIGIGLLAANPASAGARVHVFVGGAYGVPAYPYYPYPAYYYGPYYAPYPYPAPYYYGYDTYPGSPPPGYEPGHWDWRHDDWGRRVRVWVPGHLR
jgi:hypothetical protein